MKKRHLGVACISAVLSMIMVVTMLAGCGGSVSSGTSVASTAESKTSATASQTNTSEVTSTKVSGTAASDKPYDGQTIRVLLDSHPWQEAAQPMFDEFTKETGITVDATVLGEDVYWDRVNLGLSSEEPPFDVFMLSPNMTGYTGYKNNWIASLDEFINDSSKTSDTYKFDDIYSYIVDGFRYPDTDGKIYGIPLTMETYMLFYRKDLFEEQNIDVSKLETVDDWMEALQKIDTAYKDQGISAAVIRGQDSTMPDELLASVYNNWGDRTYLPQRMFYFDKDWNTQFTDPAVVQGFKTWAQLIDFGPTGSTNFTWSDCTKQFAAGTAATYWFDASVFASIFEDPEQSQVAGKVGYAAIPKTATGNGTTHWAWGLGITENSKVKDAAWQFVQWATSSETEQATAMNTYGPVRASTWDTMSDQFGTEFSAAVDKSLKMLLLDICILMDPVKSIV